MQWNVESMVESFISAFLALIWVRAILADRWHTRRTLEIAEFNRVCLKYRRYESLKNYATTDRVILSLTKWRYHHVYPEPLIPPGSLHSRHERFH